MRFGRNKALELFRGKRLIEHALASLRPFCDHLLVVANDLDPYLDLQVPLARDVVPHQGPLGGIYTALLFSPAEWIFAKATDMPLLVPALAALMIEAKEGHDAVVPVLGEHFEPLFALYRRTCRAAIDEMLQKQDERQIVRFYRKVRVRYLKEEEWRAADPKGLSFRNVNTPRDLADLEWT